MSKIVVSSTDSYRKLIENNGYYVDKTMLIKEFLESGSEITLITRPRRFGKTLNMTMLRDFFDITQDSKAIFEGTKIMDTEYSDRINSVPVVYLTFKGCNGMERESLLDALKDTIGSEYNRYCEEFKDINKINKNTLVKFNATHEYLQRKTEDVDYRILSTYITKSLFVLTKTIYEYYNIKSIVIIDEYDNPFIEAKAYGYYDDVRGILSDIFGNTFKGNDYICKGVMTGIQRIAQESIFSKFNNPSVCTVEDEPYADKFGLTEEETREYLEYFGYELNEKVKEYYDGYNFSGVDIYNPMSISAYIFNRGKLGSYWVNTSANSLIKDEIFAANEDFKEDFNELIEKQSCVVDIDLKTTFAEMQSASTLWGLLLNGGYITIEEKMFDDSYRIRIPNKEVKTEFKRIVANYTKIGESLLGKLFRALMNKNMEEFITIYKKIIKNNTSFFDASDKENSYHMLMLGMSMYLEPYFRVESNREEGDGRTDISIFANRKDDINVIIEFKYEEEKEKNGNTLLKAKAKEALAQIKDNNYYSRMKGDILLIGIAHTIKKVEVSYEKIYV